MYDISVPIMNRIVKRAGRERVLESLKNLNAKRIFLAQDTYFVDSVKREEGLRNLKENCAYSIKYSFFCVYISIKLFNQEI